MMWVKGELLTDIDAPGVDPTGQLERAAQPVPFDRRAWFRRVWRHDGNIPLICRAASEGALCWLFLKRNGSTAVFSLSNLHSFAFRPVFSGDPNPQRRRAMLIAIAKRLRTARPRIASLVLSPVPTGDGSASLVQNALRAAGWIVMAREISAGWSAQVDGRSFEAYWAARPGHLRASFRDDLAKVSFDTEVFTRLDADAWQAFEDVCRSGSAPHAGPSGFLKEMAADEGGAGCLRLGLCRVDDAVVAGQLWTVETGVARCHLTASRDDVVGGSAGTVLTAAMVQHLIEEDRVDTIDFGIGHEGGTADWADEMASLSLIEAFNPSTPAGLTGAFKAWLSRLVRGQTGG
jgi:hypothetical protein